MTNKVFTIVRKDGKIYFKNGNKGMRFLHIAPITPYSSNTYWSFRNLKFYNKENVEMKVTSYKVVNDYKATYEVYADENDKRFLIQGTGTNAGYDKLDMDWRDQI